VDVEIIYIAMDNGRVTMPRPVPEPGVVLRNSLRDGSPFLLVVEGPHPEKPEWIRCQWIEVDDLRRSVFDVDPLGVTGEFVWEGGQVIGWRIRESQWDRYLGGGHWLT
jgi:hypothetical protein